MATYISGNKCIISWTGKIYYYDQAVFNHFLCLNLFHLLLAIGSVAGE